MRVLVASLLLVAIAHGQDDAVKRAADAVLAGKDLAALAKQDNPDPSL